MILEMKVSSKKAGTVSAVFTLVSPEPKTMPVHRRQPEILVKWIPNNTYQVMLIGLWAGNPFGVISTSTSYHSKDPIRGTSHIDTNGKTCVLEYL